MSNTTTVVVRGKASFAKILGDPVLNYSKDGKEWKMDLVLTDEVAKEMKQYGIADKVKRKEGYLAGKPHMTFKQPEFQKSGKPNEPIKVSNIIGKPWDHTKLIGNDSDVEVKFVVVDYGPGKKKGAYIRSVRILKLVEFARKEFADVDENDEFYQEALKAEAQAAAEYAQFQKDFDQPRQEVELDDSVDDVGDEEL